MNYYLQSKTKVKILKRIALMTFSCLFLFPICGDVLASKALATNIAVMQLSKKITINKQNSSVRDILYTVQQQSGINFIFKDTDIDALPKKSITIENQTVESVLNKLFEGTNFKYDITGNSISIKQVQPQVQQQTKKFTLTGKVIDEDKKPVVGATVIVKNTAIGAITDQNGTFSFQVSDGDIIEISFIGFATMARTVKSIESNIIISLKKDAMDVGDVVVIGYGTAKKKDLTGSVTNFTEKDINKAGTTASVQSMLQGRIAGVSAQVSSSSPTSAVSVIVRGQSSLKGDNQPLWVIDGVPDYSGTTTGSVSSVLNSLDLNNIENLTILRDASGTAIYGSRAANGVIIVTTKSGKRNMKPVVTFSANVGFQDEDYNGIKYFEADEYINYTRNAIKQDLVTQGRLISSHKKFIDAAKFNAFKTSEIDGENYVELDDAFFGANTNWQKEIGRTPMTQNYDLSVRGGTADLSYSLSLFYKGYDGIVKTGFSDTYGGAISIDTNISKMLKIGITARGSSRKTNERDDLMSIVRQIRPDYPVYNDDGTYFRRDYYTRNPLSILEDTNNGVGNQAFIAPFIELEIIKNLKFKTAPSISYSEAKYLNYTKRSLYENTYAENSRSWSNNESTTYVFDNTLNYNLDIKNHNLTATVGFSMEKNNRQMYKMAGSKFPDDDVLNSFSSASNKTLMNETYNESALMSYFGRVQYKYSNAYLLTATIRRDGSSRFGQDSRWGTFPSVGLGWVLTEDNLLKNAINLNKVNYLKLRFAVGKTGSQNLGDYGYYSTTSGKTYNGNPATIPSTMANPELRWEESLMYDLGLDFSFFNDRLRGTLGWYKRNTTSLIYDMPVALSSGYKSVTANIAETMNTGLEFDFKYDIVRGKNHLLTLDFNISNGINKIIEFDGEIDKLYFYGGTTPAWNSYMQVVAGERMNTWYGYKYLRKFQTAEEARGLEREDETGKKIPYSHSGYVFQKDGDVYLQDTNGDGKLDYDDYVKLGSADPKFYGGFGLDYTYKNFNVNANFTFAVGHKRYWELTSSAIQTGNYNHINKIVGNSYGVVGENAAFPTASPMDYTGNGDWNSLYLYDASYLKLSTLNVNYSLPTRYFRNTIIGSLEFTFQASNLFTITRYPGMDPQGNWSSTTVGTSMGVDNGRYPQSRIYTFGIKLSLK